MVHKKLKYISEINLVISSLSIHTRLNVRPIWVQLFKWQVIGKIKVSVDRSYQGRSWGYIIEGKQGTIINLSIEFNDKIIKLYRVNFYC